MSKIMIARFAQQAVFAASLCLSTYASAVLLPGSNAMTTTQYGDFQVYSLDLLEKCAGAGDTRCIPSGPYPVDANAGFTKTQLTVMTGENGPPQTTNQPEPLLPGTPADNAFASPSGQQSSTFLMGSGTEPTPVFTGDRDGFWDIQIGALRSYLGLNDLVFIFDNAQEGDGVSQWLQIWAQAKVFNSQGVQQGCFELNGSTAAGCTTPVAPTDATTPGSYVTAYTGYCVNKVTGAAYNLGAGSNSTCDATGGYYVNGNIGSANADNAVFSQALNDLIFDQNTQNDWILSLDIRTANNNGGAETLWICSDCSVGGQTVPEPGGLSLLGLSLLAGVVARRRYRA